MTHPCRRGRASTAAVAAEGAKTISAELIFYGAPQSRAAVVHRMLEVIRAFARDAELADRRAEAVNAARTGRTGGAGAAEAA